MRYSLTFPRGRVRIAQIIILKLAYYVSRPRDHARESTQIRVQLDNVQVSNVIYCLIIRLRHVFSKLRVCFFLYYAVLNIDVLLRFEGGYHDTTYN